MTMPVLSGDIVEEPRRIGPGNAPWPLQPALIGRMASTRPMRKELHEPYPQTRRVMWVRIMQRGSTMSPERTGVAGADQGLHH